MLFQSDDLLDLQFLQSDQFTPMYTQGCVKEALLEVVELIESTIDEKRLKIELKGGFSHLKFDKRRLQQVTLNLLSNAVKFTP